ncbi:MAG: RagB/SusD family nutrient uptake outer membrane protein [Bacteroidales bacterium]
MKNNLKIISAIFLTTIMVSCNKFLSTKPYAYMPEDVAITNYDDAKYALTGIYDALQNYTYYGRDYIVYGDVYTDNIIISPNNSNRFLSEAQWTVTPSTGDMEYFWQRAYIAINRANNLLEYIDKLDATESQKAEVKGQALAIRAMAHFDLVRFYAQTYKGNENSLGIPYMSKRIILEKPTRNTVAEVYTNVINDFNAAIELLKWQSESLAPYRISYWSAKALLARVYMTQLDYDKAKTVLSDIVTNSGYKLLPNAEFAPAWGKPYDAALNTEFMFALNSRPDDYGQTSCLGYIFIQAGYGDLRVPESIKALYTKSDVRNGWFMDGKGTQKGSIFVNKYPGRDATSGLSDSPVMRLSDVYLMYAEACVLGSSKNEATAIEYLDKVRRRADINVVATTLTGQALIDAIALERRKELVYEGQYLFDLKRNHMDINSGLRSDNTLYTVVTYPDTRLAMPIPQSEIDANPNIKQNPGY